MLGLLRIGRGRSLLRPPCGRDRERRSSRRSTPLFTPMCRDSSSAPVRLRRSVGAVAALDLGSTPELTVAAGCPTIKPRHGSGPAGVGTRGGSDGDGRRAQIGLRTTGRATQSPVMPALRVALLFDMDACRAPTGVTRHALAQLERLARRPEIAFRLLTGRMTHPDGLAYWESLEDVSRRELPLRTRNLLRWWRIKPWPPIEWWTGPLDWVYCPAEFFVPARDARLAVTSHDVLQVLQFEPPRRRDCLARVFDRADLILSVSRYQHRSAAGGVPGLAGVESPTCPTRADDLFFEAAPTTNGRGSARTWGCLPGVPYLLSVANFQPRKNLVRLIKAAARLPEVSGGDLALVLIGTGDEDEALADARRGGRGGPAGHHPDAGLPAGPGAPRRLCRGHGAGLPLALRELRHPGRRGDGARAPRRAGPDDGPPGDRRRGRLVFRPHSPKTRSPRASADCSTTPTSGLAAPCWARRSPPTTDGRTRTIYWSMPSSPIAIGRVDP